MSRLGRVPPSAGRDVVDRKACFLSLLAQAAVWLLELRVARTFLDKLRPRFSGHGYPVLARTSSDAGLRRPVRVKALRRAAVFAFEPGPASRKHGPTPDRCPRQEPLGRNGPPAFTLCHRASGPFLAPSAVPSQWIQGREVELTVQCQSRANCAGVYRCQIRTYDEAMRRSNRGVDG